MATQRTGALPPTSVKPMASIAPWAIRPHSASVSTRSPAGLVSDRCHTIGEFVCVLPWSNPGSWPAPTATSIFVPVGIPWSTRRASIRCQSSRICVAESCCPTGVISIPPPVTTCWAACSLAFPGPNR